jgi:hypothetical protein
MDLNDLSDDEKKRLIDHLVASMKDNKHIAKKKPLRRKTFSGKKHTNTFNEADYINEHTEREKELDKQRWAGKKPTERRPKVQKRRVECIKCQREVEVSPSTPIFREPDGTTSFTCSRCIGN